MRQASLFSILAGGLLGCAALAPAPVAAQVQDRVVIVYGDDKCPSSNGQEIVVCRRKPRNEQFRIPQDLREAEPDPHALGGQAVAAVNTTGGTGVQVQSCNTIGAGVTAGCLTKQTEAWKAEQRAQAKADAGVP